MPSSFAGQRVITRAPIVSVTFHSDRMRPDVRADREPDRAALPQLQDASLTIARCVRNAPPVHWPSCSALEKSMSSVPCRTSLILCHVFPFDRRKVDRFPSTVKGLASPHGLGGCGDRGFARVILLATCAAALNLGGRSNNRQIVPVGVGITARIWRSCRPADLWS